VKERVMELIGKTAIVTGGARGIGYGLADGLMTYGASVAIFDMKEELGQQAAQQLTKEHEADGAKAYFFQCDVVDMDSVTRAFNAAVEKLGSVYILCNNAGIDWEHVNTWEETEEAWDSVLDVDLKGPFHLIKAVVPYWIENKIEGSIVNTSSINFSMATDGLSHYCAAKAGVSQLTKVVAGEAGRYGIRCNAIAPGLTITEMTKRFAVGEGSKWFYDRTPLFEHSSRARFAVPEDHAKVVVWLCSNYASWITGLTICVDGGNHIRGLHSYNDADYEVEHGHKPHIEW
jgi:glucose 1-dehydrogenase